MDSPKYIEDYSILELEKEVARRKKAAITRKSHKVVLRSEGVPPIYGTYEAMEDTEAAFVVYDNIAYKRSIRSPSLSGQEYQNVFAYPVKLIKK